MENSGSFWNKTAEWLMSLGLPHITGFGAIMILTAAVLILLFALWLVFRKIRLWYWKTNIQIDTLKSIDVRLHNVEEKLTLGAASAVGKAESETPAGDGAEPSPEFARKETAQEKKGLTAIGRSGRIYTEAELELQIRE